MSALATDLLRGLDPVEAAAEAGYSPDPWAADLLRSEAKRTLVNVCRGGGKSECTAFLAVHHAVYTPESLTVVLSPTQRQSKELLLKAKVHARRLGRTEDGTALELVLENRSRIVALPGEASNVRGYHPSLLIVDEGSRVSDELYVALRPMLAITDGRLIALSTPFGRRGWYYGAWQASEDGLEDWERVRITAYECPRISNETLERERQALGDWAWRQEFLCEFVGDEDSLYRREWIEDALDDTFAPLWSGPLVTGKMR